jgi:hypothetical protein
LEFLDKTYREKSDRLGIYYIFGSQVVALRDNGTLYFLHGDNPSTALRASLGSASLTTDVLGNVISTNAYYPFGASRLRLCQEITCSFCCKLTVATEAEKWCQPQAVSDEKTKEATYS